MNATKKKTQTTRITDPNAVPLKRMRIGRDRCKALTEALRMPIPQDGSPHPFGVALRGLRESLGNPSAEVMGEILGINRNSVIKLETHPEKAGVKTLEALLDAYGLAITLRTPKANRLLGYPELHAAFIAKRYSRPDLTQRMLQERSGVGRTTIQQFEHGEPIKLGMMLRLFEAIDALPVIIPKSHLITPEAVEAQERDIDLPEVKVKTEWEKERELLASLDRRAPSMSEILYGKAGKPRVASQAH